MTTGIKISDHGKNVSSASPSEIIFSSEDKTLMARQVHQVYVPADPSESYQTFSTTIEHGLGFPPAIMYFVNSKTIGDGWRRSTVPNEVSWDTKNIYVNTYRNPTDLTIVIYVLNINILNPYEDNQVNSFYGFNSDNTNYGFECFDSQGRNTFSSKNKKLVPQFIMSQAEIHDDEDDSLNSNRYFHNLGKIVLFQHFVRLSGTSVYTQVPDALGNYGFSSLNYIEHFNGSPFPAENSDRGYVLVYKEAL